MTDNNIALPSGKTFYAYGGIVGIGPDSTTIDDITYGYDGSISEFGEELTKEEQIMLADLMIERWTKFKEAVSHE